MRLNVRHIAIAVVFLFTQICAAAALSDHIGDPLHSGDECTMCSSIGHDLDDLPPPATSEHTAPPITADRAISRDPDTIAKRFAKSTRARAPPASA